MRYGDDKFFNHAFSYHHVMHSQIDSHWRNMCTQENHMVRATKTFIVWNARKPKHRWTRDWPEGPGKRSLYCTGARWYGERTARSLMANGARIRGKDIEDPRKDPCDVKKEKLANSLWRVSTKPKDENNRKQRERKRQGEKERRKRKEKRGWRRVWQRPVEHLGDITSSHHPTAPGIYVFQFALSLSLSLPQSSILSNVLLYASNVIMLFC